MSLYNDKDIKREIEISEMDIEIQKQKTDSIKKDFINKIKTGLGEEIKKNPKSFKIRKKTTMDRIKNFIKKIFLKF